MSKTVLGILAHVDAGKTTLSESILYLTGIRKLAEQITKMLFWILTVLERERGITIFSKQAEIEMRGRSYTPLDTPGHGFFQQRWSERFRCLTMRCW